MAANITKRETTRHMCLLMKEHTVTYNFAKKSEPDFDKGSGSITNLQEIQRTEKQVELHAEEAMNKIQMVENS